MALCLVGTQGICTNQSIWKMGAWGRERVPELSVVGIPLTVEALGPSLPLLLLHSAHGAKGLRNQGDSSPKPVTPHFLITF